MIERIPGIKMVRAKGRRYYYHRKTGVRILAEPNTRIFLAEVANLNARATESELDAQPDAVPTTLGELISARRASEHYKALAPRTKSDYQRIFNYLEPLSDMPLSRWSRRFVKKLQDKTFRKHKRKFANRMIEQLGVLFRLAISLDAVDSDPTSETEKFKRPRGSPIVNRAWRDVEIEAFLVHAPLDLLVAFAIALFTGLRKGDVVTITWGKYVDGTIETRALKNGAPITIPAHAMLRQVLDATGRRGDEDTIVVGARGRTLTKQGFTTRFFRFRRQLVADGVVGKGPTFHGLRHTIGKMLAEALCSTDDIMAILGVSRAMAEHYSKEAERVRRSAAAIRRLERNSARKWKTGRKRLENQLSIAVPNAP
jgi:integrase